jgi:hypothetical protein
MRTISIVYSEAQGEIEGAFDENGELLSFWSCNDATWRNEYFGPFMKKLGIKTVSSSDSNLTKRLEEAAEEMWG